jgi:hypothetical protein
MSYLPKIICILRYGDGVQVNNAYNDISVCILLLHVHQRPYSTEVVSDVRNASWLQAGHDTGGRCCG